MTEPTDLILAAQWACAELGLPKTILGDVRALLSRSSTPVPALGLAVHHDRSGRVDLGAVIPSQVGRPDEVRSCGRLADVGKQRWGLEHLRADGGECHRVDVGVPIDPGAFDVAPSLRAAGVSDAAISDMTALADRLPLGRVAGQQQQVTFSHFSVSWPDSRSPAKLTSHLTISSVPPPTASQRRDAAVLREGRLWPDQLRWAAQQPPVRRMPGDAESRLATWRAEVDPRDVGRFETRLARDGLTPVTAAAVFASPSPIEIAEPTWWPTYERLVKVLTHADGEAVRAQLDAEPEIRDTVPYAHVLLPIATAEGSRLATAHVGRDLHLDLLTRLSQASAAALSEVMWRDVPFGARFLAQAGGSDHPAGRDRYLAFCDRHRSNGLSEILCEYPVLGRLMATLIDQWHRASAAMLTRVAADREALADRFGVPATQPMTGVTIAAGDRHNGGSAVAILTFGDRRVVYKPRSVRLEALYADTAAELSRHSDGPPLYAPAVIQRRDEGGEYGYVDFVAHQPCGQVDLPVFYRNAGRLLALLDALMATDCHHENLIAMGDQLVLIDAETLLLGAAEEMTDSPDRSVSRGGGDAASILRVGMLPTWLWLEGRQRALDISALGVPAADESRQGPGWRAINTDAMVAGHRTYPVPHPTSLPGVPGAPNRLASHAADVVAGFTDAYHVLLAGRATWLADLLTSVEGAQNRAVLRPTYVYASLISSLLEPSALRSMVASGMVCERLTRGYLDAVGEAVWPVVAADQEALLRMDVPYFSWPVTGGVTRWWGGELQGWPEQDQLARARDELARRGSHDLRLKVALIRASIRASTVRMDAAPMPVPRQLGGPPTSPRQLAARAMQAVADGAFTTRDRATWMGLTVLPDGVHTNVSAIGPGLYDGRMGLAVGLLLWARSDPAAADRAVELCRRALAPLLAAISDPDGLHGLLLAQGTGLGGLGGLLRGLAFVRRSSEGIAGVPEAERTIVQYLTPGMLADDPRFDVIAGPAGLVAPLGRLLRDTSAPDLSRDRLHGLIAESARVLAARQERGSGGWVTMRGVPPLTGLAHGASGIALALAEAAVALQDATLLAPALRGLEYEAEQFDNTVGNWRDLRPNPTDPAGTKLPDHRYMLGWCAGAPGIALTRLRLMQLLPDHEAAVQWRADLTRAADTTATAPLLTRDHVCCGNLGRVVILRTLAAELGDNRWDADIERIATGVAAAVGAGWPRSMLGESIPDLPEPGFFTGLPGASAVLFGDSGWVPDLLL